MNPMIVMVTDRHRSGDAARLIETVEYAASAGVDLIQVRERGLEDRDLFDMVRRIIAAAASRARVLVNLRTDVALAAGASGVHLPGTAPPASRVRTIVPPGFLIGRSVHDPDEARAAERDGGCDYLIFGTVFASAGKPAGHEVAGVDGLRAVCRAVRLPVIAIGGMDGARAREAAAAGAAGLAAIGMFVPTPADRAGDPARAIAGRVAAARAAFDAPPPV